MGGIVGLGFFFFISGKELVKYRAHMEMADVVGFFIFFLLSLFLKLSTHEFERSCKEFKSYCTVMCSRNLFNLVTYIVKRSRFLKIRCSKER